MAVLVTAATTALATYVGSAAAPIVTAAAVKAAQVGTLYIGSVVVGWNCESATQFMEKHCESMMDSIACASMATSQSFSCAVTSVSQNVITASHLQDLYMSVFK